MQTIPGTIWTIQYADNTADNVSDGGIGEKEPKSPRTMRTISGTIRTILN